MNGDELNQLNQARIYNEVDVADHHWWCS